MFSGSRDTRSLSESEIRDWFKTNLSDLEPAMLAALTEIRQTLLSAGLSTERTDWDKAKETLTWVYKDYGYPAPRIIRCASPWQACVLSALLVLSPGFRLIEHRPLLKESYSRLKERLDEQFIRQFGAQLHAQMTVADLPTRILNDLRIQLDRYIQSKLRSQNDDKQNDPDFDSEFWSQLWSALKYTSEREIGTDATSKIASVLDRHQINHAAIGHRDGWYPAEFGSWSLALHAFAHEYLGATYDERSLSKLSMWLELFRSVHVYLPFEDVCFVSDRPTRLFTDGRHLHCANGTAIEYSDGYSLYFWHGVGIDRARATSIICNPETITRESIDAEPNQELRRIMLERFGIGRYMMESGAILVHGDDFGSLYKMPLPGSDEELTAVAVKNATIEKDGTRKEYFLHVHPELRPMLNDGRAFGDPQPLTARNAIASTFGLRGEEYCPRMET